MFGIELQGLLVAPLGVVRLVLLFGQLPHGDIEFGTGSSLGAQGNGIVGRLIEGSGVKASDNFFTPFLKPPLIDWPNDGEEDSDFGAPGRSTLHLVPKDRPRCRESMRSRRDKESLCAQETSLST